MGGASVRADAIEDLLSEPLQYLRFLGEHVQHESEGRCRLRNGGIMSEVFDHGETGTYSIPSGNHDIECLITNNLMVFWGCNT